MQLNVPYNTMVKCLDSGIKKIFISILKLLVNSFLRVSVSKFVK